MSDVFKTLSLEKQQEIEKILAKGNIKNIYIDCASKTGSRKLLVKDLNDNVLFGCMIFRFNVFRGEEYRLFDANNEVFAEERFLDNEVKTSNIYQIVQRIIALHIDKHKEFCAIKAKIELHKLKAKIQTLKTQRQN